MTKQSFSQDATDGPVRSRPIRIAARVALIVGAALLATMGLSVLGAFAPGLPVIGIVGSILSGFAGWLGMAALAAVVISAVLLLNRRSTWRYLAATVAALSLLGCVIVSARLISVGHENGVSINPLAGMASSPAPDELAQYAEFDGEPLDVAIWKPRNPAPGARSPIAFFVHGGGWVSGTNTDDASGMKAKLADAGWLVVSVGYTLADPSRQTWDVVEGQVACAMAWTVQNAPQYSGDPETFVVLGESAGGNLAINTSYRTDSGELTCRSRGQMPTVDGVVALYPGVDPYALYDDAVTPFGEPARTFMQQYIGGSPAEFRGRYDAVKSSNHISASSPPTLVLQGESDHLVGPNAVYDFVGQAQRAGIDTTLVRIPYGEHGFDFSPMGSQLYADITFGWLDDRGLTTRGR